MEEKVDVLQMLSTTKLNMAAIHIETGKIDIAYKLLKSSLLALRQQL